MSQSPVHTPTDWQETEKLLDQFDQAWQDGTVPVIDAFLPPRPTEPDAGFQGLLLELVKLDLEYRRRRARRSATASGQEARRVEDYVKDYPELDEVVAELAAWEYRVRHHCGDRPGHAEYLTRFAGIAADLKERLTRLDADLAVEFAPSRAEVAEELRESLRHDLLGGLLSPPQPSPSAAPIVSIAALIGLLRRHGAIDSGKLDELEGQWRDRPTDPRGIARELLEHNWLTPYQVNQWLQGHAQELVLGQYLLLERLGEGGAGQVFKARHLRLGRLVALKVIRKELLAEKDVLRRFYREMRNASRFDHPHIVHAIDSGPAGTTHFLAMDYVDGIDLARLVKQGGPLPVEQACAYIRQAALGLQHAHERGLVHRDVKPHNLILSRSEGLVKVADLGLARLQQSLNEVVAAVYSGLRTTGTLTPENAVMMGTADYLAPEQALDFHTADTRADIYSLGCTFYFLLAGQPPFAGGTMAQKVAKHMQVEPPPLSERRSDLPADVNAIVRKMMAKLPAARYQTPGEAANALAGVLGIPATAPVSSRKRRPWFVPFTLAAGLLLGILGFSMYVNSRPGAAPAISSSVVRTTPPTLSSDWILKVHAMKGADQVQEVKARFLERNPHFNGQIQPRIKSGEVIELTVIGNEVTDLAPLGALPRLRTLSLISRDAPDARLTDLAPLQGMGLQSLTILGHPVRDLAPLSAMPLTHLSVERTQVRDLTPLRGLPLHTLECSGTPVSDLEPLRGMHHLTSLTCNNTGIKDLGPLKGMRLTSLHCRQSPVASLAPLRDMPIRQLSCNAELERETAVLESFTAATTINGLSWEEFWKKAGMRAPKRP